MNSAAHDGDVPSVRSHSGQDREAPLSFEAADRPADMSAGPQAFAGQQMPPTRTPPSASGAPGVASGRAFWTYWAGQTISTFGTAITTVVLPLLVFQMTRSALTLSFTVVASVLPYLLFGLVIGAWVDRVNRRRVMILTDLGRTIAIASIPLAAAVGMLTVWWIFAVAGLTSTLAICFDAANFAAVPSLVNADELVRANGRIQASYATARVAGPLVAGVLFAVLTLPQLLLFDAASFLVSAGSLLLVGISFNTERQEVPSARQESGEARESGMATPGAAAGTTTSTTTSASTGRTLWQDIGEGLRYVLGHPVLRSITLLLLLINFILPTISAQQVLFASQVLRASDAQIGFLYASASGGTVLVSLLAPRVGKRVPLGLLALGGLGVEGLAILAAAQLPLYAIVLPLWAVRGGADVLFTIATYSLTQRMVPNQLLGRTITTVRVLTWSTASVGAILGGLAITATANPALVYSVIGVGMGIISLLFCWSPVGRVGRCANAQRVPPTRSAEG